MTIAKRLILLLAVPLLALTGLGVFTRWQLTTIETRSRFVAELQVPSLATLGNISRILADLRVQLRSHVLAASESERASVRSVFERDDAELDRLLDQYERNLVSEDRDRRLLKDYRGQYRDWLDRAKQIMSLADAGRREEAGEMLRDTAVWNETFSPEISTVSASPMRVAGTMVAGKSIAATLLALNQSASSRCIAGRWTSLAAA